MVVYFGMSERLPNLSYYDSTGQNYGFSKPYSEERAKIIDEEVSRIIEEQYKRAKDILSKHAEGHAQLTDVLLTHEVIFTEDVEKIFGKRQWTSRTDEILAARSAEAQAAEQAEIEQNAKDIEDAKARLEEEKANDDTNSNDGQSSTPPPLPKKEE
jgi:cell division protease FtsH